MEAVYMSPISRILEIGLAVSAIAILFFMARIFVSKHAWGDGAQYEMLDLPTPAEEDFGMLDDSEASPVSASDATGLPGGVDEDGAEQQGLIGLEDRIVRFGFTIALSYLSITWFGIFSMAMWLLIGPVTYLLVTAFAGKDPIYKWLGLTTEFE